MAEAISRFENRHFRSQGLRVQLPPNYTANRARKGAEKRGSRGPSAHATRRGRRRCSIRRGRGQGRQAGALSLGGALFSASIKFAVSQPSMSVDGEPQQRGRGDSGGGFSAEEKAHWSDRAFWSGTIVLPGKSDAFLPTSRCMFHEMFVSWSGLGRAQGTKNGTLALWK